MEEWSGQPDHVWRSCQPDHVWRRSPCLEGGGKESTRKGADSIRKMVVEGSSKCEECMQSGWSTFSEREAKAKMGYIRKIYVGGSMVAEVGRGVLLGMGLKSDWWRAVNRIAMDYNLDGVYYMLKYRRLSAEGKRLARIPDEWVEEMAKEKVERKVRHRELEKWRGKLKGTERTRRYAEERKDLRMERYADGGDGARVRMMVRGDSLLVRANANVAWRYDEDDRKCVCGEEETEKHVLFECPLYERHRIEWNRVWKMEKGQEDPMNGVLGFEVLSEMDCLILRSVGDWAKCFLCQKDDGTALKTPGQTPRYLANPDELGASFRSTIVNLKCLHDLGELPSSIFAEDIVNLGNGVCMNEFINSMMNHGVVWHKLCKNAVDTQKVKRAQRKRSAAVDISEDMGVLNDSDITKTFEKKSPMKTRRKLDDATTQNHCFICDKEFKDMESMRRVSTFGVDKLGSCDENRRQKAEKAGELKIPESENDMPADECVDEKAFDAMIEHLLEQRGSVALISLISLRTFYLQQLNSFGYKATIDFVHATKLRHRIIERLPDIKLIEKNRICSGKIKNNSSKSCFKDMANLKNEHPDVYQEFQAGHFVGQKTRRKFSMMPLDQIHEQLNDWNLELSGTWTTQRLFAGNRSLGLKWRDSSKRLREDVLNLIQAFEDLGNPFLEESADLLDLDQSIIMPDDVINNVRKISSFGRELYNKFLNERVFDQKVPFNETLKEVNLRLFKDVLKSKSKSTKATISALKDEHSQASHLLLAAQGGRHISDDLFGHESSKFPPALTKDGEIDHSTKSEILDCLHDSVKRVLPIIETFVTRLYGVEGSRKCYEEDFVSKQRQTSAFVWGGLLIRDPLVPSPEEWGWQRSGSAFVPHYISLPPLSSSLPELSFCSCKSVCKRPCKCIVNKQSPESVQMSVGSLSPNKIAVRKGVRCSGVISYWLTWEQMSTAINPDEAALKSPQHLNLLQPH
ncbi:hypothetical protein CAPTEDRAFT_197554 [Capitella teleta]|uniref:Uncharacterized protein n=1 Tax=Capitella teleta TaxID=283909 RepID=R7T3D6_CAPTE|nr:hypothetical protein CAPTEDRAFT_197554 [Capitella teleta]|eukprot:ELT87138.1 hypothetical protein CAPTEDRAFT_197554 [Capitella teleta]